MSKEPKETIKAVALGVTVGVIILLIMWAIIKALM